MSIETTRYAERNGLRRNPTERAIHLSRGRLGRRCIGLHDSEHAVVARSPRHERGRDRRCSTATHRDGDEPVALHHQSADANGNGAVAALTARACTGGLRGRPPSQARSFGSEGGRNCAGGGHAAARTIRSSIPNGETGSPTTLQVRTSCPGLSRAIRAALSSSVIEPAPRKHVIPESTRENSATVR
jgi:hypothetical protein